MWCRFKKIYVLWSDKHLKCLNKMSKLLKEVDIGASEAALY